MNLRTQERVGLLVVLAACGSVNAGAADAVPGAAVGEVFAAPAEIKTRIAREFPAFDADFSGELQQNEFVKWLTPLKELQSSTTDSPVDATAARAWASEMFPVADTDKNGAVSAAELAAFLGAS